MVKIFLPLLFGSAPQAIWSPSHLEEDLLVQHFDTITLIPEVRLYTFANNPGKIHILREKWKVVWCMDPGAEKLVHCWARLLTTYLTQQMSLPYEALETQTVHILWFLYPLTPHIWLPFLFKEEKLLAFSQFTADVGHNCQLPRKLPPGQGMRIYFSEIPILRIPSIIWHLPKERAWETCSWASSGI